MKFNYFSPSHFLNFVVTCKNVFETGEPGLFLFFPKTDQDRRIDQFIQNVKIPSCHMLKLELALQEMEGIEEVEFFLEKHKRKNVEKTLVFVTHCEVPVREKRFQMLDEIVSLGIKNPHYRFIFFSEIDLTHPAIAKGFSNTHLFASINYYPLYDKQDTLVFINYLSEKWNLRISKKFKEDIYKACGGHFWLVKEALRNIKVYKYTNIKEIIGTEGMKFKLEQIYLALLESEREVLEKLIHNESFGENAEYKHSVQYLETIGFISGNSLTSPIMEEYIKGNLSKIKIVVDNKNIRINGIIADYNFSKKEIRILRLLLQNKGVSVTRYNIASAIWPVHTEKEFSEWAIDRLISRLRIKLHKIGLKKDLIKTLRGKGYLIDY